MRFTSTLKPTTGASTGGFPQGCPYSAGRCSGSSMFKSKTARCTTFKPKEVHSHSGSSVSIITCTSDELHLHWCRSRHHLVCMTLRPKSGVAENLVLIQQVHGSQTAKLKPSIHIMLNVLNPGDGKNTITQFNDTTISLHFSSVK